MTGGGLPMAAVSRVFQCSQCGRPLAAASSLQQFLSASQDAALCQLLPFLDGFFFNWKKQQLQSLQAGRRHVQPCVPASQRCSPPLPLCAHQTKQRLLMLMPLSQSGLTLPLLPPPPQTPSPNPRVEGSSARTTVLSAPNPQPPPSPSPAAALLPQQDPPVLPSV